MKCFEVVRGVLDATYEEISETDRDENISSAIKATSRIYGDVINIGGPDFNSAQTRFGYVYTYVPAHSHWVYDLLEKNDVCRKVFESGNARISCIGGGPGSDLVGVLKYLDKENLECKLFVEIVDGCAAWKSTWVDVAYSLEWPKPLHTDYVIHDVADRKTWSAPSRMAKADLIIFSFFLSEIYHLDGKAEEYVSGLLAKAKKGALLLVNDNRLSSIKSLIDKLAEKNGYVTLESGEDSQNRVYDWDEHKSELKAYEERFGTGTRLTGNMFWRIYQKK